VAQVCYDRCVQRLLIVSDRSTGLWGLEPPDFTGTLVHPGACLSLLRRSMFDCVVVELAEDGSPPAWLIEKIGLAIADRGVPVVLAVDRISAAVVELVSQVSFTAMVDRSWGAEVVAACLRMAVRAEQPDQSAVQAQHDILSAVAHEASRLKELSITDDLTGLYNRRYLDEILAEEQAGNGRFGQVYSVVVTDLDDLKKVNARHGHAAGSKVLNAVGSCIASALRAIDYGFRYGGDEFAFVLSSTAKPAAHLFADHLRGRIDELKHEDVDGSLHVTISMGIASFPDDGPCFAEVFVRADRALFGAKTAGKDRVAIWDGSAPI